MLFSIFGICHLTKRNTRCTKSQEKECLDAWSDRFVILYFYITLIKLYKPWYSFPKSAKYNESLLKNWDEGKTCVLIRIFIVICQNVDNAFFYIHFRLTCLTSVKYKKKMLNFPFLIRTNDWTGYDLNLKNEENNNYPSSFLKYK